MYKVIFILLILCSGKSPTRINTANKEKYNLKDSVIEYIKKDVIAKKELAQLKDSIYFKVYKNSIPFDIVSICEDLISKEYNNGFSFNSVDSNINLKMLATKVRDSLIKENTYLNDFCASNQKIKETQLTGNLKNTFVVFFSEECQEKTYAKVVPSHGVIESNGKLEFYGEAYTYLFCFDKAHQIIRVYEGMILYN